MQYIKHEIESFITFSNILVPIALSFLLAGLALARGNKGLWGHRISGLHVCSTSHDVSKECMRESLSFRLPFSNSLFQTANQKNSN